MMLHIPNCHASILVCKIVHLIDAAYQKAWNWKMQRKKSGT